MSLLEEIQSYELTHQCQSPFAKTRLLVRVPIAVIEQLNPTHKYLDLFNSTHYDPSDTDDYVYLQLFPNYDTENDRLGEKGFRNTFSQSVFAVTTTRRGFKATILDQRRLILDILRRLIDISETSAYNKYVPIKVIDFCSPEVGATYSIRYGAIAIDNYPSITGDGFLSQSWEFSFKEAQLRIN
ncbi:hypothetical protein LC605_25680 [Nostoc sp. CHAB 5836]|uniref:hypothetical protein n=1 Tax=Nostoc sp. CHAB 5836 TaxID=2780404 RepID=UPI001E3383A0|nr:hypothetical protein [Nostoc sp. CHAB 5836]MCC5618414.1 hypothetical protein [Nostoc sp. CHAB 5836]